LGFTALANSYLGNHANTQDHAFQCTESTNAQKPLHTWRFAVSIASTILVDIVLSVIIMHALQRIKQVYVSQVAHSKRNSPLGSSLKQQRELD